MGGPVTPTASSDAVFGEIWPVNQRLVTRETGADMSEAITAPRLEQGTALSHLGDAVEDLRRIATDLQGEADEHAMITTTFLRDVADDRQPDPAPLLRSRGRIEGLLRQLLDRAEQEDANLTELNITLLPNPDGDADLEARALDRFRERYRRRGATKPTATSPTVEPSLDDT